MALYCLSQIAVDTGGQRVGDARFSRVCTDTRSLQAGDLFIALCGERFDGNQFVAEAVERGAVAVVVTRAPDVDIPYLLVDDPRLAYGQIARFHRRQFKYPVIALTGSTGKTSSKEMLAAILSEYGEVLATEKNYNNEIGVPATLLNMHEQHRSAVIEMGACRAGDIRYLCQFAEPTIAIVTNAMEAHIESFGDLDTVATTKGEVYETLSPGGVAIINLDDRYTRTWHRQSVNKRIVTFSEHNPDANVYAKEIQLSESARLAFTLCVEQEQVRVELAMLGRHNVSNALAAAAAASAVGASLQQIKVGLEKSSSVDARLQPLKTPAGILVIDDTYNANPGSVKAAIDVLTDCAKKTSSNMQRSCLILGTMAELGSQSLDLHRQVAQYAQQQGVDQLLAVGEYATQMVQAFAGDGVAFTHIEQLLPQLNKQLQADVVLVKGSRSAQMEKVVYALMGDAGAKQSALGEH